MSETATLVKLGVTSIVLAMIEDDAVGDDLTLANPVAASMTPDLVSKDALLGAASLGSVSGNSGRILGPMLATILIKGVGATWCIALNAVSFVVLLGALLTVLINKVLREGWPVTRIVTIDGVESKVNAVAQLPAGAVPAFIGLLLLVAVLIEPYVIRRQVPQRLWARLRGLPPPPLPDSGGIAIEGAQTKGAMGSDRELAAKGIWKLFARRDTF